MAERAGAGEVVGVVGAAAGAVLHVVEGDVALVADGAGAAVAISAVDCFPFVRDAQGGDPGLPEGRAEELDEAGVGELLAVEAFELAVVEEEIAGDSDAQGDLGCWGSGYLDWGWFGFGLPDIGQRGVVGALGPDIWTFVGGSRRVRADGCG